MKYLKGGELGFEFMLDLNTGMLEDIKKWLCVFNYKYILNILKLHS